MRLSNIPKVKFSITLFIIDMNVLALGLGLGQFNYAHIQFKWNKIFAILRCSFRQWAKDCAITICSWVTGEWNWNESNRWFQKSISMRRRTHNASHAVGSKGANIVWNIEKIIYASRRQKYVLRNDIRTASGEFQNVSGNKTQKRKFQVIITENIDDAINWPKIDFFFMHEFPNTHQWNIDAPGPTNQFVCHSCESTMVFF